MEDEKFFPISVNPSLCVLCQRCMFSCHSKAIFFKESLRLVNYDKCQGCLKCVDVCEHGAIEVISIKEGKLKGFQINHQKCDLCKVCLEQDFCFQNLFVINENKDSGENWVEFHKNNLSNCFKCLKCFKNCPNNAIVPIIE